MKLPSYSKKSWWLAPSLEFRTNNFHPILNTAVKVNPFLPLWYPDPPSYQCCLQHRAIRRSHQCCPTFFVPKPTLKTLNTANLLQAAAQPSNTHHCHFPCPLFPFCFMFTGVINDFPRGPVANALLKPGRFSHFFCLLNRLFYQKTCQTLLLLPSQSLPCLFRPPASPGCRSRCRRRDSNFTWQLQDTTVTQTLNKEERDQLI